MVGDDQAIEARTHRLSGVLDVLHALEHDLAGIVLAQPVDVRPVERVVHAAPYPGPEAFDPFGLGNGRGDVAEEVRAAVQPDVPDPGQVGDPIPSPAQRQMPAVVAVEAIADIAIAGSGHRQVDGEGQHRAAQLGGALQQRLHVAPVLDHIELEPGRPARALGHLLHVADRHGRKAHRHAGLPGGAGGLDLAPARIHARHADRGEHHGHGQFLAQHLGLQRDLRDIDQHPLAQVDLLEVLRIGPERRLRKGAAVDIVEQHLGDAPARQLAVVGDVCGAHADSSWTWFFIGP